MTFLGWAVVKRKPFQVLKDTRGRPIIFEDHDKAEVYRLKKLGGYSKLPGQRQLVARTKGQLRAVYLGA